MTVIYLMVNGSRQSNRAPPLSSGLNSCSDKKVATIMAQQVLRKPELKAMLNIAGSTIYSHIAQGILCKPIQLGPRAVGWPANEIDAILQARIAGKSEDDIKALVCSLTAARQKAA